jgi:hypothetical protein
LPYSWPKSGEPGEYFIKLPPSDLPGHGSTLSTRRRPTSASHRLDSPGTRHRQPLAEDVTGFRVLGKVINRHAVDGDLLRTISGADGVDGAGRRYPGVGEPEGSAAGRPGCGRGALPAHNGRNPSQALASASLLAVVAATVVVPVSSALEICGAASLLQMWLVLVERVFFLDRSAGPVFHPDVSRRSSRTSSAAQASGPRLVLFAANLGPGGVS